MLVPNQYCYLNRSVPLHGMELESGKESCEAESGKESCAAESGKESCAAESGKDPCAAESGKRPSEQSEMVLPPLPPARLGNQHFLQDMGIALPYLCGAMADGISSVDLVTAIGKAGMLGFFGAAGLELAAIEDAVITLKTTAAQQNFKFGCNLIHSPFDKKLEAETVELYLRHGIDIIEASAFMGVTMPLVRYRTAGLHKNSAGEIIVPQRIIAKVSREELVQSFFSPPPSAMLKALQAQGAITAEQAELATQIPMADCITAEADSGGHTDKRALVTILPAFIRIAEQLAPRYPQRRLYVGAAGGIAEPRSALAAFSMGAAYVVSGSINQCCVEANTSTTVKKLLAQARPADITMAAAADMFEMGIQVQVLKRGTMFPMRAQRLYQLYRNYDSIAALPAAEQKNLATNFFHAPLDKVWKDTAAYFKHRDPQQLDKAARDHKHQMALLFRNYLGKSSQWARHDDPDHRLDFQIWCGAAMGSFNAWVADSCLAPLTQRKIADVAMNILFGAALLARLNMLRLHTHAALPDWQVRPRPLSEIEMFLQAT